MLERSWAVVRPGGHLVTLRLPLSQDRAEQLGIHATFFIVRPEREGLEELARLVDTGRLRVPVAATYPLSDGRSAFASGSDTDRPPGKTVLVVDISDSENRRQPPRSD